MNDNDAKFNVPVYPPECTVVTATNHRSITILFDIESNMPITSVDLSCVLCSYGDPFGNVSGLCKMVRVYPN